MQRLVYAIAVGLMVGLVGAGVVMALVVMPYKAWKTHAFRAECDSLNGFVYHDKIGNPMCLSATWKIIAVIR